MFFNREEVFSSADLAEVMRRETILSDNKIPFKTKIENTVLRLAGTAFSRSGLQQETYRIYVKKEKAESARYHLDQNK